MNVIHAITTGGVPRAYKKCRCGVCGTEAVCTPSFDFFTKGETKEELLVCEMCLAKGALDNGPISKAGPEARSDRLEVKCRRCGGQIQGGILGIVFDRAGGFNCCDQCRVVSDITTILTT